MHCSAKDVRKWISRYGAGRMLSSPLLTHQKSMEQFLMKTVLSLAEQFYNQDCKERCTQNLVGREKKLSGRNPHPLWRYPEEERHMMGSKVFPGEQRV